MHSAVTTYGSIYLPRQSYLLLILTLPSPIFPAPLKQHIVPTPETSKSETMGDATNPPASGLLPARYWAEPPPAADDAESTFGGSSASSTASVASSMYNYRMLHGRRYHGEIGDVSYWYLHLDVPCPSSRTMGN